MLACREHVYGLFCSFKGEAFNSLARIVVCSGFEVRRRSLWEYGKTSVRRRGRTERRVTTRLQRIQGRRKVARRQLTRGINAEGSGVSHLRDKECGPDLSFLRGITKKLNERVRMGIA